MKIDLYHLYRRFSLINLAYPIVLDTLKVWAESAGWQARAFVCKESAVDISSGANVVGFSVYTQTANATYRVAEKLRAAGKIVILGGPHFRGPQTFAEAVPYCDVLVSSICEQPVEKTPRRHQRRKDCAQHAAACPGNRQREKIQIPESFLPIIQRQEMVSVSLHPHFAGLPLCLRILQPFYARRICDERRGGDL